MSLLDAPNVGQLKIIYPKEYWDYKIKFSIMKDNEEQHVGQTKVENYTIEDLQKDLEYISETRKVDVKQIKWIIE